MPHNWPLLSLVVLDPDRHPKIHRALVQFQDLLAERDQMALWSIKPDEALLVQLTLIPQHL